MQQRIALSILGLLAGAIVAVPAAGQGVCPEGRAMTGECVNPGLARMMRQSTILYTQPKLSFTNPPILPGDDRKYLIRSPYQEDIKLFTFPPPRPLGP